MSFERAFDKISSLFMPKNFAVFSIISAVVTFFTPAFKFKTFFASSHVASMPLQAKGRHRHLFQN